YDVIDSDFMTALATTGTATIAPAGTGAGSLAVLIEAVPSAPTTSLLWDGQYQDPTTGLYDMRARWYDPATGQFLSVDPALAETDQPYAYAGDDPVNEGDPSGKDPCLQQFSLTGALLTIGTHTPDALPPPGPIQIPPLSSWPAVASFCGDWACLVYQENLSTRSVQWGFVMYIPLSGFGEWDIYVLLNGAVFNQKHQWYTPHGSLPGKVLKPGDEISIIGEEYVGVGVAQVMPNLFTVR
ncbi:MAG TPA: RHS repeat-associated core domain-containing protein, partial [Acidimicrobiales bacterium]|nr:RHS repeat-associated core domain-containing protein [Acidimicrobiales bacterium]